MKKVMYMLVGVLMLALASCASLTQSNSAELVIQYATVKFINNDVAPVLRAKKVVEIASAAKTFLDDRRLPLSEVETLIRQKIKWGELDPADTLLANALIMRVRQEIENVRTVPDEQYVSGSTILGWIIKGAKLAGG